MGTARSGQQRELSGGDRNRIAPDVPDRVVVRSEQGLAAVVAASQPGDEAAQRGERHIPQRALTIGLLGQPEKVGVQWLLDNGFLRDLTGALR